MQRRGGLSTFFLLLIAIGGFGAVLWANANNAAPLAPVLPTEALPTDGAADVSQLLDSNFGSGTTPVPKVEIPQMQPTRAVVAQPAGPSATPIRAADAGSGDVAELPVGATPTLPPATVVVPVQSTRDPDSWSPPPLIPPISRDPLGRDHFWLHRPIASDGNNSLLFVYTFGSDGPDNQWRVHHGIDLPNPIGEEVYAAWDGTVVFSSDGRSGQTDIFQNTSSYGNVVFIEHDFSWDGQPVYTLYAHLQASLVTAGDVVQAGDPIALVGNTGVVSGPHVHFEVRIGSDRYGATYNPVLWMVPYEGHGVIAGRVVDQEGDFVDDILVTIRSFETGLLHPATVTTYNFPGTVDDVNPDPNWQENFAITDIPVGRWDVIVNLNGQRIVQQVEVFEGTTSFVELRLPETPTEESPEEPPAEEPASDETTEEESDG